MKPDDHHCPALNKSGGPCQRYVKTGASFCWVHDPSKESSSARGRCSDLGAVAGVSARTWTPESWEAEIAGCRADASRWGHDTGEGLCWRLAWHLAAAAAEVRPRPARAFSISSAVWAITFGLPSVY